MSLQNNPHGSFTFEIAKISGKRLTTTLFKQLYQQNPFNSEYELLYELKGKIHHGKEFVIFVTPLGIRKFDTTTYKAKIRIHSLAESLYCCMHGKLQSLELDHIKREVCNYFQEKMFESNEESIYTNTITDLINGTQDFHKQEHDQQILLELLGGDFKVRVLSEYQKGLIRVENRNKLADTINATAQIFL